MRAVVYQRPFQVAVEDVPDPQIREPGDAVRITTSNICGSDLHMYEAGVKPGDTVAVFGAGPVGLLAAHSSYLRGAASVFVADMEPDRLALAERFGATAVSLADGDSAEQILSATGGLGADRGVEAVGYQAHDNSGEEHPEMVLDALSRCVRATGGIGVVGVYVPKDPGAANESAKSGRIGFNFGAMFQKGQHIGTGQCPVKRYNEFLRDLIIAGKATPSLLVSHEVGLDEAPAAYERFDKREDGWTKVLLHPAGNAATHGAAHRDQ